MFNLNEAEILKRCLLGLEKGFSLPGFENGTDWASAGNILAEVAEKMQDNYPYFHPLYAGQMLKPPHPVARMAYALAMYINPNNHALDGSRASSPMEKEVVAQLAQMFGWKDQHLGHLTGGGTMANLEALWVAGKSHPGKKVVASELSHYTHERISTVLGLPFQKIPCDTLGRMDVGALEAELHKGEVGTVVVTLGTTGTGSVDPLASVLELQAKYPFRVHVDAAYGGYFMLASNLSSQTRRHFDLAHQADSIVIDPHKHGLQPYGCGCILFKDTRVGKFYKHDSPYTYFTEAELHLGEISLECSRAGAAAVALWATLRQFPLEKGEAMAKGMEQCHNAGNDLYHKIVQDDRFIPLFEPETDIVTWAPKANSLSQVSARAHELFHACAKNDLHLALLNYPSRLLPNHWQDIQNDSEYVTCLRSCLMKWEHIDWVDEIWKRIMGCYSNSTQLF